MTLRNMEAEEPRLTERHIEPKSRKIPLVASASKQSSGIVDAEDKCGVEEGSNVSSQHGLHERLAPTMDSDSQDSSSHAFAEPVLVREGGEDSSEGELSDLEFNFDGPIEWPESGPLSDSNMDLPAKFAKNNPPLLENAAAKLLLYQEENADFKAAVDPQTQARLEALLEAAGIGKLSNTEGKAFADPEVLRKLTSSVSCALDEAAAALTRMRAETQTQTALQQRTLAEACSDGDIEAVKRLLSEGRSVHETTEEGESLLSLACSAGYYELAEVLLRMRANVEDRGIKGDCTPLMEAASGGFVDIVRLLIAYEADVNAQSSAGHTALHHAAVGGYEEVVRILIEHGANVEEQNENGHTPLMEAASAGHVNVAQILLDSGAGINTHSNEFKESALTLACYKGHLDMVKFLLDAGADQEHKTDEMHTALMEASMDGHVEVARLLLDSGAQVNMPVDSFESPLTLAACGGHVELANLLIERGANLEEVNDEGYTPLMEAAREGHEEMVALLLAHGADVNSQTEETQETALTLACCGGFLEVAHFLIRANADIELGCSTPLMEASQEGHIDLVKYLIKQGSDVQAMTGTGDSALTYACENGHTDVAEVLLQAGSKLEHESEGGRTPLMKAARAGHLCTVQFLISKGADVNRTTTNTDHTVLSLACAGGHLTVVELLLEHGADPMHKLKDGSTMLIEAAKGGHTNVVNLLLDYPHAIHKSLAAVSAEYPDGIPMADDLPADVGQSKELSLRTTESLAGRLEQFIHKMMSQAENSSGTKEEQMARKQEILEELQRVEQELKYRTQMAQLESQPAPLPSLESQEDLPIPPPPTSLSSSPPTILPNHEVVKHELQQKQQAIKEQQRHEQQLQQQKEFYQAKLQVLKQQYQAKQLQLQQQRQHLISEATSGANAAAGSGDQSDDSSKRQPIPLHIALQNHLHAHHVTEGNVNDLAQALQDWDTRDRNVNLPATQVKPMPAFNLSPKNEEEVDPPSLPLDSLPMVEPPTSRALADSLASLIHGRDHKSNFDSNLERAIDGAGGAVVKRLSADGETTMKTLKWLEKVDADCKPPATGLESTVKPLTSSSTKTNSQTAMMTVPKPVSKKLNEGSEKTTATKITKIPNGFVEHPKSKDSALPSTVRPVPAVPSPQRSISPARVPCVDPNAETDSNHDTALTLACAGGHSELVRLLLDRNAEIEHRDKKGFTPLILASTAGHAEVVEILIDHGADIEAQSERTKDTPLSLACSGGRYEVVEILLRLGANKEHRNVSDYTPLSLAASGGYVNIIKLLLSYGAEINSRTGSKLGISPLMLAAMNGHTAAVKLLLDMGSDINAQIETNRNTALTLACFQGRHDVVSLLVDRKANIEHRAKTGLTPLMEAASGGYVDVGRVLLDKGADVNAPPVPSSKDTALTIAADKGHYRFVELLLSRGAAVDVKNKKGNSPLWLACNGGHLDVVQLLVSNRADIDSEDNRKVSSLMTAFRKGHVKVVKWLVRHVTQFPSDKECARYITTVNDKELLRKCQSCMEIIVQAKEAQAKEAQKNAEFLLEQIESEKSREEKRKEAAARKREKKKQKRKEKQAEAQSQETDRKRSPTPSAEANGRERSNSRSSEADETQEAEDDEDKAYLPIINNRSITKNDKKAVASSKKEKTPVPDPHTDKENTSATSMATTSKKNRRTKDKSNNNKNDKTSHGNQKVVSNCTRITELDDFGEAPITANVTSNGKATSGRSKRDRNSSNMNQVDAHGINDINKYLSPSKHSSHKSNLASPSPGKKKRDEGWKEVVRKSKKVVIPSHSVGRVLKQLNAIREMSGANIDVEKAEKKASDRTLIIRGSAEVTRQASNCIAILLTEHDKHFDSHLNKKSALTGSSSSSNGSSAAPTTTTTTDTMSSIGTFSIADFIVTTQVTAPTDTKPKPTQSKTGWPSYTKPSSNNHHAWGATATVANSATITGSQTTMSPRHSKPASTAVSKTSSAPPKQPSDVSRQLFTENKAPPQPAPTPAYVNKPRLPQPVISKPPGASVYPVNQTSPPVSAMYMAPQQPAVSQSITRPQLPPHAGQSQPIMQRPPNSYSPFNGQDTQGSLLQQHYHSGFARSDQIKAPGYKPTGSPRGSPYAPSEDMMGFSRAPGSRPSSTVDPLMSPLPSLSVSTSVPNSYSNSMPQASPRPDQIMNVNNSAVVGDGQSLSDQHKYSIASQPMTLPRIASSLNPNASEFTTSAARFMMNDTTAQQSPRSSTNKQQTSPVDLQPSPPVGVFQPQPRLPTGQQTQLPDQMFNQMFPPAVNHPPQMVTSSNFNQVPMTMTNQTYSPSSRVLMMQESMPGQPKLEGSPPANASGQGDVGVDIRGPRPIGGERPRRAPLFPDTTAIWGSKPTDDWTSLGMSNTLMSDPVLLNALFKTDGSPAMISSPPTATNTMPFYGMGGASGDGLQNTWHNSPSKMGQTQDWPTWNQSNPNN